MTKADDWDDLVEMVWDGGESVSKSQCVALVRLFGTNHFNSVLVLVQKIILVLVLILVNEDITDV